MGKFVIRRTGTGYKFDLKAANGETIATSEVYSSAAACVKGAARVAQCAAKANLTDLTAGSQALPNPRFELYQDKSGGFRFRLKARNGKIIAVSEGYTTKAACENGILSVRRNAADSAIS